MPVYKDIEKRKLYQKLWARENALKKKMIIEPTIAIIIASVVEVVVESINPEEKFCLDFHRLRDFRTKHNLSDFSIWMFYIRTVNKKFLKKYKIVEPIVEIAEPVVETIVEVINPVVEIINPVVEIINPVVEIVEKIVETMNPVVEIVETHFNCIICDFTMKRTKYNSHHNKCIDCFYPNQIRGKCLVILEA